jgi:DNA-binding transcriptional ArsR family regulator
MQDLGKIQSEMFSRSRLLENTARIFEALSSDCRLEIVYLLLRIESLPSGQIARLTNCTPSQISQYLARMYDAGIVQKRRTWRTVEYSLNREDPFVTQVVDLLSVRFR